MKISIFLIFFSITNFIFCQYFKTICEEKGIEAFSLINIFRYEEGYRVLFDNYEKCKNDCSFIRIYNDLLSISKEENFKKLKEKDIEQEINCYSKKENYLLFGTVFYYLRKNKKEKINSLNENMVRHAMKNYIYFNYLKENSCENFIALYEKDKNISFGDFGGAYLMYKCGKLDKAREIASVRYYHFKKDLEKKGLFYEGLPRIILENYIYSILFNIELKAKDKERFQKAKEYFPYIFDLYGFKNMN